MNRVGAGDSKWPRPVAPEGMAQNGARDCQENRAPRSSDIATATEAECPNTDSSLPNHGTDRVSGCPTRLPEIEMLLKFSARPGLWSCLVFILTPVITGQAGEAKKDWLAEGRQLLAQQQFAKAEKFLVAATESNPQDPQAWSLLGYSVHAQKRLDEALKIHLRTAEFPSVRATALYNAACVYALKGENDQAFRYLEKAFAAGFQNRALLRTDSDLSSLRNDPRMQKLLPPLRRGADAFKEQVTVIHSFDGEAAQDEFGWVARRVGDIDADGIMDFATSAPSKKLAGPHSGRLYVYSGKTGKLLFQKDGNAGDRLGNGVAGAGDVNADGIPDVIAGAPSGGPRAGQAFVFSGKDGNTLHHFRGSEAGDGFGTKVAGVGDWNGDQHPDLLIGALRADANGTDSGACYIYSGKTGELLFRLQGENPGDQFGSAVDGTPHPPHLLAIGAMNAGPQRRGKVYVYKLEDGAPQLSFVIEADATGNNLGQYFVSILGDVNGDQIADVFSADFSNTANGPHSGRIYVHSGHDGRELLTLTGQQGEGFGTSVSQAGDVNHDGHADLIIGAWQNREVAPSAGKCYLHSGKDGALLATYTCTQAQDTLGFDAQGLGDVNGDGALDFLLTSAWSEVSGPKTGRVFIVAGPSFETETANH